MTAADCFAGRAAISRAFRLCPKYQETAWLKQLYKDMLVSIFSVLVWWCFKALAAAIKEHASAVCQQLSLIWCLFNQIFDKTDSEPYHRSFKTHIWVRNGKNYSQLAGSFTLCYVTHQLPSLSPPRATLDVEIDESHNLLEMRAAQVNPAHVSRSDNQNLDPKLFPKREMTMLGYLGFHC